MLELLAHTILSDGIQTPAEALRAAKNCGCRALAIADHADASNLEENIRALGRLKESALHMGIDLLVGVELTHVPPALLPQTISQARSLGAEFVAVHGESLYGAAEMHRAREVERGVNLAALLGNADLLAHPGMIREEEAALAAERGILLGLSCNSFHAMANGHIVKTAQAVAGAGGRAGTSLALCAAPHRPEEFLGREQRLCIAQAAGLELEQARAAVENPARLLSRLYKASGCK